MRQRARPDLWELGAGDGPWPPDPSVPFRGALAAIERRDLLEVLDDRSGRRSTLVASQVPVDQWHKLIGDATIADAIMDRLVHSSHRLELAGESMRRKKIDLTEEDQDM